MKLVNRFSLYVLGAPRAEIDGAPVQFERRVVLAFWVYLVLTERRHRREELAAVFWPESDENRARAALRRTLSALRKLAPTDWLEMEGETIRASPGEGFWCDVYEFRRRVAASAEHEHAAGDNCAVCAAALAEAVQLYRADFLAGFTLRGAPTFDDWAFFQAEELRSEVAAALEELVRRHSRSGEFEIAIKYARKWLQQDPLHEPAHRHLIQLYAWSGRRAAAMHQFHECARLLMKELSAKPQEATNRLFEAIKSAPQPLAYLRVIRGGGAPVGDLYLLGESTNIGFGRAANDIHLEDDFVSRAHARIEYDVGEYRLRDLGSKNGTRLNNRLLNTGEAPVLALGDEIAIGGTVFILEKANQAAADSESIAARITRAGYRP